MYLAYILAFFAVIFTVLAQNLLKLGSMKAKNIYFNYYTLFGYFIYILVTLMNTYAYSKIPLKSSVIFLPMTYIFIIISSVKFFKEEIRNEEKLAIFFILLGIVIYSL